MAKGYTCNIAKIDYDSNPRSIEITVTVRDGNGGPYNKVFKLAKKQDQFISLEMFVKKLQAMDLSRPKDPFAYLKKAMEDHQNFEIVQN